jgi:hypothetical protein
MKETSDTDPDGRSPGTDSTENRTPSKSITDPGLTAPSGEVAPEFIKQLMAGIGGRDAPPKIEPVTRAESKGNLAAAYHAGPRAAPASLDTQPGFEAAVIPPPDARHEPTVWLPHAPGKPGGPLSDEPAPAYESESPGLPIRSPRLAWVALALLVFSAIGVLLLNRPASNEGAAASASTTAPSPPAQPRVASAHEPWAAPIAPPSPPAPTLIAPPEATAVHVPATRKSEPERPAPIRVPPPPKSPIPSADTPKPPPENELIK